MRLVRYMIMLFLLLAIAVLSGCGSGAKNPADVPTGTDKLQCEEDADCVCGGRDADGSCFLGNRQYYETYVDKREDCPDFCEGTAGNLMVRCVANKCIQTFECITDFDCDDGRCVNNRCAG